MQNIIDIKRIEKLLRWDARIGVIYISSSLTLEREWQMVLPSSVSFHTTRISLEGDNATEETIINMLESGEVEAAAKQLIAAEVDIIAFACTAGSFIKGVGWDKELASKISKAANDIPVVTTSGGLLDALQQMGCKKIHLATPYVDEITIKEKQFLEANGVQVRCFTGEQCIKDQDIARVSPERFIKRVVEMMTIDSDVDGIFISCTNSRTVEIIDILEEYYNIPVFSSNQVTLWAAMKGIFYEVKMKGYGRLFLHN